MDQSVFQSNPTQTHDTKRMKTIIAGGREIKDRFHIVKACLEAREEGIIPTEVVSGGATGADFQGEQWAKCASIPVKVFLADWLGYGYAAGPIRNRQMAAYADALIAVWDGKSRGTKNMIEEATKRGLKVYVHKY